MADRLAHLGQRRRIGQRLEERAHLVVALERRPDLLDLNLVDAVLRFRTSFDVLAQQQLHVDLQHIGDLVDDGELVEPADPPLHLVDPALGFTQPVREDLLGHLASAAPIGDAAADRQLVHGASPTQPATPAGERSGVSFAVLTWALCAGRTVCVIACMPTLVVSHATCKKWICPNQRRVLRLDTAPAADMPSRFPDRGGFEPCSGMPAGRSSRPRCSTGYGCAAPRCATRHTDGR